MIDEPRPLFISELIKKLQAAEFEHGDRPVYAESSTEIGGVVGIEWDTFTVEEGKVIVLLTKEDE